ncbi:MAG: FMN-binding protein [Ruminococcaceae bacterium]|nr:FMN-binding protein [Oscillospiraceae bacterium]
MQAKNSTFVYILKIFLPLLLICAVVAGVISGISVLTKSAREANDLKIEQKKEQQKLDAIAEIYGADAKLTKLREAFDGIDEVRVGKDKNGGTIATVTLTVKGYSNGLQVFVAFADGGEVRRVMVLASNETNGIGSKVSNAEYLKGYEGLSGDITFGGQIDKIAGASVSSKALLGAVNAASDVYESLNRSTGGAE